MSKLSELDTLVYEYRKMKNVSLFALKEEIIHYNAIINTTHDKKEQNQLQKIISSRQKFIDKYKEFGSDNW